MSETEARIHNDHAFWRRYPVCFQEVSVRYQRRRYFFFFFEYQITLSGKRNEILKTYEYIGDTIEIHILQRQTDHTPLGYSGD